MVLAKREPFWSPQYKQAIFMSRWEYEVLYGGAAGGGKSDALLVEALRQVGIPHYKGILFRKTYKQLEELIDRSRELYKVAYPGAKYNGTDHAWTFPSGAKVLFGNMQYPKDRHNYQGKRFDYIGFDELTHFTLDEYVYMFSRNRPNGPGTRVYIRAATNPGGIGHGFVKGRFIMPGPPFTTVWENIKVLEPGGKIKEYWRSRIYIPATVYDNKKLLENDPMYIANLGMLPEREQQALLYGNWDIFSGQAFMEWRNEPNGYFLRKMTHVIDPFPIPGHWKIYRGFDWAYSSPFAVVWIAFDENRRGYLIKEWYGGKVDNRGYPTNQGIQMDAATVAAKIVEMEKTDPMLKGRHIYGVADPSIFNTEHTKGMSTGEIMEVNHCYFEKGANDRISGKQQFHYRLRFNDNGFPMFQVFSTCPMFIYTFPNLVLDERDNEDVDTRGDDHLYDATRYVLMENPVARPVPEQPIKRGPDPLDLTKDWRMRG